MQGDNQQATAREAAQRGGGGLTAVSNWLNLDGSSGTGKPGHSLTGIPTPFRTKRGRKRVRKRSEGTGSTPQG